MKTMNYWDYIKVEELLALQGGVENDPSDINDDETLFIVVHQVFELWFKLILRELTSARDDLNCDPVPDMRVASTTRRLRRVATILRQAVQHFEVMETLSTRDYLGFRDKLIPASGFQSAQMREIEILLGLEEAQRIRYGNEGSFRDALKTADGKASKALVRVETRQAGGPTLKAVLGTWLARTPIDGEKHGENHAAAADAFVERFLAQHAKEDAYRLGLAAERGVQGEALDRLRERYAQEHAQCRAFLRAEELTQPDASATDASAADALEANAQHTRRVRAALVFIESYRELPRLAWARELLDALLEVEQRFIIFRQRHARMVERVIGRRTGTGGSSGVDYLDQTALRYRVFDELWSVRTLLLRQASVPALANETAYRFLEEDTELAP